MKITDFNSNLIKTAVVFNEDEVKVGDVIHVYHVSDSYPDGIKLFRSGIVVLVDSSVIKYSYYDKGVGSLTHDYIHADNIVIEEPTEEQENLEEPLYVFKIVQG